MDISLDVIRGKLLSNLTGREEAKANIDCRPHFVPISIDILEATLSHILDKRKLTIANLQGKLVSYVIKKHSKKLKVTGSSFTTMQGTLVGADNINTNTPAIVFEGSKIIGLLYASSNSYNSAYQGIFRDFFNTSEISFAINTNKYTSAHTPGFDIGHTNISYENSDLGTSPLNYQVSELLKDISDMGGIPLDTNGPSDKQLSRLVNVRNAILAKVSSFKVHNKYSATIQASLSKEFKDALLSVNANIVIIQDRHENSKVYAGYEAALAREIKQLLHRVNFSRNLIDEVEHRIVSSIKGITVVNTSKVVKLKDIIVKEVLAKITKQGASNVKLPAIRNLQGQFYSLASLQMLINEHLPHVLSANMGGGTGGIRKDILNYRTGRFATSAKVERMSQSQAGAISAFYSMMKNPYMTFSEGGEQSNPRSRDPKLLISKSIAEIAAIKVANRMRAILI